MKRILFNTQSALSALCIFMFIDCAAAQKNLVPNYSFENYINCPIDNLGNYTENWFKPDRGGGAYYNACGDDNFGVPKNKPLYVSFQYPRTGNAYFGALFRNGNLNNYVEVQLSDSLKPKHTYYAEYFVNLSNSFNYACNNHSMLFTNNAVYVDTNARPYIYLLPANPQITNYGNPIITDTLNWVKVSGVFKANGGEKFLTLGNFRDYRVTAYKKIQVCCYGGAGYFMDDVSVYDLDSFRLQADAGRDTTITKGDSVFIGSYTNGIDTLKWLQNGTTVVDTARPGFWVWPTANTFYVLTQTVGGYTSSDTVYIKVLQPLPVSVVSGELLVVGEGVVQFSWQTANEADVWRYVVERSTDGQHFESLGVEDAAGLGAYRFMDYGAVVGMGYYRVKVVGHDGKVGYSKVYSIRIDKAVNRLSLLPNPADNLITVKAASLKEVRILNTEGRVVCSEKTIHNTSTIDISRLPKGIYLVKGVQENNAEVSEKLIKE